MKFLIILILILLPTKASADMDISEYMKIRNNLPDRFDEKNAPFDPTIDLEGGRTELDIMQRRAKSKRDNEAGIIGEKLIAPMFWDTGAIPYIGSFVAELGLENDPNFNIHVHIDEFMTGVTANYTPWFTRRADSYEEGIMLRDVLLDRLVTQEKVEAAGWRGVLATVCVRMVGITLILLLLTLIILKYFRQRKDNKYTL